MRNILSVRDSGDLCWYGITHGNGKLKFFY